MYSQKEIGNMQGNYGENYDIYLGNMGNYQRREDDQQMDNINQDKKITYERMERNDTEQFKLSLISKYQDEIAKLKAKNITLQNQNKILLEELEIQKIKQKNTEVSDKIVNDIMINLNLKNESEIVPKLKEYMDIMYANSKNTEMKEGFIQKMYDLYLEVNGTERKYRKDNIDLNVLINWVKNLLNKLDQLCKKHPTEDSIYKDFCDEIMDKNNLKNLTELREFINDLLQDYNINKRRVEKLKDVLTKENSFGSKNYY